LAADSAKEKTSFIKSNAANPGVRGSMAPIVSLLTRNLYIFHKIDIFNEGQKGRPYDAH